MKRGYMTRMFPLVPLWILMVLWLAACAPTLAPTLERDADAITVTVLANAPAYAVTLSVLDATTDDERCAPIGPDFGCVLGDIGEGQAVVVTGTATGEVSCVAFGFSDESQRVTSYRPWPCVVVAGGTS